MDGSALSPTAICECTNVDTNAWYDRDDLLDLGVVQRAGHAEIVSNARRYLTTLPASDRATVEPETASDRPPNARP